MRRTSLFAVCWKTGEILGGVCRHWELYLVNSDATKLKLKQMNRERGYRNE